MESWAWFCKKTAEIIAETSTSLQLTVSFVLTWLIRSSHMASLHFVEYSFPVPQSIGGLSWPMRHIAIADYYVCRKQSTALTHTHTHPFSGPYSGTTWVSWYQKGKTDLNFTEARESEWQWHQLGHMQVSTSLQTDNHANTPPLSFFYRLDALPAAQPTVSKH